MGHGRDRRGATGLGIALDAATRGYATLLLERDDFAQATSSRSTRLLHGGVRYLRQGNLKLVMGALRERGRGRVLANAPHLDMARSVQDVLARRTRTLLLDARASIEIASRVAALLADALGRDAAWQAREVAAYTAFALGHLPREVQSVSGACVAGGI